MDYRSRSFNDPLCGAQNSLEHSDDAERDNGVRKPDLDEYSPGELEMRMDAYKYQLRCAGLSVYTSQLEEDILRDNWKFILFCRGYDWSLQRVRAELEKVRR